MSFSSREMIFKRGKNYKNATTCFHRNFSFQNATTCASSYTVLGFHSILFPTCECGAYACITSYLLSTPSHLLLEAFYCMFPKFMSRCDCFCSRRMQYARALKERGVKTKIMMFPNDVHAIKM